MATRCNIFIYENQEDFNQSKDNFDFCLYKHNDGHPAGVGEFLEHKMSKRMFLVPHYMTNELIKSRHIDGSDIGFEITYDQHGDIDYYYVVFCDERIVRCYHTWRTFNSETEKIEHHEKMEYEHFVEFHR